MSDTAKQLLTGKLPVFELGMLTRIVKSFLLIQNAHSRERAPPLSYSKHVIIFWKNAKNQSLYIFVSSRPKTARATWEHQTPSYGINEFRGKFCEKKMLGRSWSWHSATIFEGLPDSCATKMTENFCNFTRSTTSTIIKRWRSLRNVHSRDHGPPLHFLSSREFLFTITSH